MAAPAATGSAPISGAAAEAMVAPPQTEAAADAAAPAAGLGLWAIVDRALFDHGEHVARVEAMRDTWGRELDVRLQILDFGEDKLRVLFNRWCSHAQCHFAKYESAPDEVQVPAEVLDQELWHLEGLVWAVRRALEQGRGECRWVLLGQDMLFLHLGHLRSFLARFDPSLEPVVLGNRLKGFGGAGSVMASPWAQIWSRAAAERLVGSWESQCRPDILRRKFLKEAGGGSDYGFGWCFGALSPAVPFPDTRDDEGRDRFYLWPPSRMDKGNWWDSWYPNLRLEAPKQAFAPDALLFFFAGPAEIRQLGAIADHRGHLNDSFRAAGQPPNTTWKFRAEET